MYNTISYTFPPFDIWNFQVNYIIKWDFLHYEGYIFLNLTHTLCEYNYIFCFNLNGKEKHKIISFFCPPYSTVTNHFITLETSFKKTEECDKVKCVLPKFSLSLKGNKLHKDSLSLMTASVLNTLQQEEKNIKTKSL